MENTQVQISEQQKIKFANAVNRLAQTIATKFDFENAIILIENTTELVNSNPQMLLDISKFDQWDKVKEVGEKIGNKHFKDGFSILGLGRAMKDIQKEFGSFDKKK